MKLHLPFYYKQGNYIKEMTSEQCGGLFNFFTQIFFYYQVYRQSIKSWNKSIIACNHLSTTTCGAPSLPLVHFMG